MAERDLGQNVQKRKEEEERRAFLKQLKRGGLTPEESESMASEFAVSIPERREAAKKERSEAERKARWGEFAEQLARSITQYAAAKHGAAIDAGKADWSDAEKRIAERYKQEAGDIDKREEQIIDALGKSTADSKMKMATGVQEKETGLPVYRIEGKTGYFNIDQQPVEVERYQKPDREIPDVYRTSLIVDPNQVTESGNAVYKKITTNKANPQDFKVEIVDETGQPIQEKYGPKTGLDAKSILSDKEASAISSAEAAMEMLDKIETDKPNIDTGPIKALQNWSAQTIGVDDPSVSGFKADVQDTLNRYIKEMTGAQMSEAEAKRLLAAMPTMRDNDQTFMEKLRRTRDRIRLYNERYKKGLRLRGRKVGEEEKRTPATPPAGQTVKLRYKDGKIYEVTKDKVQQALDSGDWELAE